MMISVFKRLLKFRFFFTIVFLFIGLIIWASYPNKYHITGSIFGTYYNIILYGNKFNTNHDQLKQGIEDVLNRIDQHLSTYSNESEIISFNSSYKTSPISVSDDFYYLLKLSKELYPLLNNAWDPTLLPLSQYYGFGDGDSNQSVSDLKQQIGFNYIQLLPNNRVKKVHPKIKLDFSSIAKGYAVDQVIELFIHKYGIKSAFVDIGGEIRVIGKKVNKKPWGIGIMSPYQNSDVSNIIYIDNMAVATSGNYMNYVTINDQDIGHILDPRTVSPITHSMKSVSVIADSCAVADALATALFVMGPNEAKQWLSENTSYPAYLIFIANDGTHLSESFNAFDLYQNH